MIFVRISGSIRWRRRELFISEVLNAERIGIFEIEDDKYEVRFGPILLGYIEGKHAHIRVRRAIGGATLTKTVTQLPGLKLNRRDRLHIAPRRPCAARSSACRA